MIKSICIYSLNRGFLEVCSGLLPEEYQIDFFSDEKLFVKKLSNSFNSVVIVDAEYLKADETLRSVLQRRRHRLYYFSDKIESDKSLKIYRFPYDLKKVLGKNRVDEFERLSDSAKNCLSSMCGSSVLMENIRRQLLEASKHDGTVLITGESGTGKSLAAMIIHQLSKRSSGGKKMITENIAAISQGLIESELFGVKKGAFTDSGEGREGLIGKADKNTIFLDEIGELEPYLQSKLLHVVENKEIRKVGSDEFRKVDVRFIFATNQNLEEKIRDKTFRLDLFYRICETHIHIPPLREHIEDIESMVEHYFSGAGINKRLSAGALEKLMSQKWQGNVRQLNSCLLKLSRSVKGETIFPEQIDFCLKDRLPL